MRVYVIIIFIFIVLDYKISYGNLAAILLTSKTRVADWRHQLSERPSR